MRYSDHIASKWQSQNLYPVSYNFIYCIIFTYLCSHIKKHSLSHLLFPKLIFNTFAWNSVQLLPCISNSSRPRVLQCFPKLVKVTLMSLLWTPGPFGIRIAQIGITYFSACVILNSFFQTKLFKNLMRSPDTLPRKRMNIITILCIPETHPWTPCFKCIYLNYPGKLRTTTIIYFPLSSLQCLAQCWTNTKWLVCQKTCALGDAKWEVFGINSSKSIFLKEFFLKLDPFCRLKTSEHNIVQPHHFEVIQLWILKLDAESGFTWVSEGNFRDSRAQLGHHTLCLKENIRRIFPPSDIVGIARCKKIIIKWKGLLNFEKEDHKSSY